MITNCYYSTYNRTVVTLDNTKLAVKFKLICCNTKAIT